MIKIENVIFPSPKQWEFAIRGMRNPMNSWTRSDSYITHIESGGTDNTADFEFFMGEKDENLAKALAANGPVHAKYRRMLTVYMDITAPLYWWKEFDTYKVGTVANSCSTMHKIADKEFTIDDFSTDHLFGKGYLNLVKTVDTLNEAREKYLKTNDKNWWWQMIQLLPSSYNQRRAVMVNYEVLGSIVRDRSNHKLDEWCSFCDIIREFPHNELITGEGNE